MREKLFRSITLAVAAAITVGVAPSLASVDLSGDNAIVADGMVQQKQMRRVYKPVKAVRRVAARKPCTSTTKIIERTIEKPVVIEKQVEVTPAAEAVEQTVTQPAVVEGSQPVIIDRYEKRHRSLIHLGLFPINLLGD